MRKIVNFKGAVKLFRVTLRRDGERVSENREISTEIISEEIYYAADSIYQVWESASELVRADQDREIVGIAEVVESIFVLKGTA